MEEKKILLVDDEVETLRLVGLTLERAGHEILVAASGRQALEKARAQSPDLIVLDILMPDMDGYEVARQLRADPDTVDIPILMFTCKDRVQDKVTGFESGANDYVTKPIHPEELRSRVQALLQRSPRARPQGKTRSYDALGLVGAKGGVGTTTLAVNTAVALAQRARDQQVVLAELRSGTATAAFQLGLSRQGGIRPLLDQPPNGLTRELVESQLEWHSTGLSVLTGESEPAGVARPITLAQGVIITRHLDDIADTLILDLGMGLDDVNRRLLPLCRHVAVTVEPNDTTLALAEKLLTAMTASIQIPQSRISLVVINKSRVSEAFTKDALEARLRHTLRGVIPPAPELALQSANRGTPMVLSSVNSFVVQQYRQFAEEMAGVLSASGPSVAT